MTSDPKQSSDHHQAWSARADLWHVSRAFADLRSQARVGHIPSSSNSAAGTGQGEQQWASFDDGFRVGGPADFLHEPGHSHARSPQFSPPSLRPFFPQSRHRLGYTTNEGGGLSARGSDAWGSALAARHAQLDTRSAAKSSGLRAAVTQCNTLRLSYWHPGVMRTVERL